MITYVPKLERYSVDGLGFRAREGRINGSEEDGKTALHVTTLMTFVAVAPILVFLLFTSLDVS